MRSAPCGGCHPDHGGPNGALTSLDESTFPHDVTGFSLSGHRDKAEGGRFTCADCHPKGYGAFDQSICATCHAAMDASFMKQHEAAFGTDCLPCHDGGGNASVDHSKFAFKLTGKHAAVALRAPATAAPSRSRTSRRPPQDCYACHAKDDKHKGAYGQQCGDCHSASGWGDVTFDHNVFPLDHGSDQQKSTCQTCHPNGTSTYTCFGCHAHTTSNVVGEHEGKSLAELQDCIKCHQGGGSGGD